MCRASVLFPKSWGGENLSTARPIDKIVAWVDKKNLLNLLAEERLVTHVTILSTSSTVPMQYGTVHDDDALALHKPAPAQSLSLGLAKCTGSLDACSQREFSSRSVLDPRVNNRLS